jgi:ferredoxin
MPLVEIEAADEPAGSSRARPARVVIDEPLGGRLLDLCDEAGAPVPFSCRSASCGTCRVEVLEGAGLLSPPGAHEREVLELFGDGPDRRLACVAVVLSGPGRLRLRIVSD